MPLTAAAGTLSLEATPLARIGYSSYIVYNGWENDFIQEITNNSWDREVTQCNQVVQFTLEPDAGPWRRHENGQLLIDDQITPQAFHMKVCQDYYKAIRINNSDVQNLCERFDEFEGMFLKNTYNTVSDLWKCFILNAMLIEASPANKGDRAGRNCNINLGKTGSPRAVTAENIHKLFSAARQVLVEQHRWVDGEMFAVVAPEHERLILDSPHFIDQGVMGTGGPSSLVTGQIPGTVQGFNIYVTNSVPTAMEAGGLAHSIIFGHRDAYAFVGNIIESRIVNAERSFTRSYQMRTVFDGMALIPSALAVGYVTTAMD